MESVPILLCLTVKFSLQPFCIPLQRSPCGVKNISKCGNHMSPKPAVGSFSTHVQHYIPFIHMEAFKSTAK